MNDETRLADTASAVVESKSPPIQMTALPSLADCLAAVAVAGRSGIDAIPELAKSVQSRCPELGKVLVSSAVRTGLETYARQDGEAIAQEKKLKREATQSNISLLAAGVTSGVILAVSAGALQFLVSIGALPALDPATVKRVTLALGLLTLAFGALAAYFGFIARDQGRIARWQTCRSEAELSRLDVFTTIAARVVAAGPAAALFGLAVVARHLLEDQRAWLGKSADRHRTSSERTSMMGGIATALAFVGGSGAVIASQTEGAGAVWIVLVGVVGSAIGAYAANREALNRDRANADRYDKTRVAMDAISGRTDEVAGTIAAGEPNALQAFTKTISDLLAAEHQQWLDGTAQANAALDKLDGELAQLGKAKDTGGARPASP